MKAHKFFCHTMCVALAAAMLNFSGLVFGQAAGPEMDMSCSYFSPNPNDTAGPPILFFADLSADAQAAPTESRGIGRADFVLERENLNLSWRLTFRNLTTEPVGVHIHAPVSPGSEAPVLFDMAPGGISAPVEGERILTLGEVAYLVQNLMYVNLHTFRYPAGELRGAVKKARPRC